MKTLKLNSDQFAGQLECRICDLDREKTKLVEELKITNKEAIENLAKLQQRKADHVKYFHDHIMLRIQKFSKANFEQQQKHLDARVRSLESEKNNSLDQLRLECESNMRQLQLEKAKRLAHIKYFADNILRHVIKKNND